MHSQTHRLLGAVAALALVGSLAGCGGGSSSGGPAPTAVTPAPTPTPSPTPTPTPTPSPSPSPTALSGPAAIAQVGEFTVLGYEASFSTATNTNDRQDFTENFEGTRFRYLASGVHELLLPMFEWSRLGTAFSSGTFTFSTQEVLEPGGAKSFLLTMLIPGAGVLPLSHTGFATWYSNRQIVTAAGRELHISGSFAYGVATSPGNLPTSGMMTYQGFGDLEGYGTPSPFSATVDFSTGRIDGKITPIFTEFGGGEVNAGTFDFSAALAAGSTAVTVDLPLANGKTGKLEIQFTGPAGEELMFRFRGAVPCLHINGGDCAVVMPGAARRA